MHAINPHKTTHVWAIVYKDNGLVFGMYFSRAAARSMLYGMGPKSTLRPQLKIVKADLLTK